MEWRLFNTAILFFENASMGIITQGIEKITCRWDSTLNMVKYNHNMRSEVYSMKKLFKVFSLGVILIAAGCCTTLGMKKYISLIALTALTVFISQCIGIIKYKVEKEKN